MFVAPWLRDMSIAHSTSERLAAFHPRCTPCSIPVPSPPLLTSNLHNSADQELKGGVVGSACVSLVLGGRDRPLELNRADGCVAQGRILFRRSSTSGPVRLASTCEMTSAV